MSGEITAAGKSEIRGAADAWAAFLGELDACERTRDTYRKALRQFARWLDANGLDAFGIDRSAVVAFKDEMAATRGAKTANCYLTAVRRFYSWAESRRVYPNVAAGVRGCKTSKRNARESLTPEQAARLLGARREGLEGLRDAAMLELMTMRGLRTIEVARANVEDLQRVGGQPVLYVQGKGYADKGEFVVLSERIGAAIFAYLFERGEVEPSAPLFASHGNRNRGGRMTTRSISRIAKAALSEAGAEGPRYTAHSLRHTAVTFALMGGATVQEAQQMARHADISTTMVYAHNLDRMQAKAERAADSVLASITAMGGDDANPSEPTE